MDDLDLERFRRLSGRPDTAPHRAAGAAAFVGTVTTTAAAGNYMVVTPVTVTGTESEGGTPVLTAGSGSVVVYNLGPGTPTVGDNLVCRLVDYRWAAARGTHTGGGGPTHTITPCACTGIPDTIYTRVPSPDYSDFTYWHLRPATLTWQTNPSNVPGATIWTGYWSETLQYTFTGDSAPVKWRYFLRCQSGGYRLCIWYANDTVRFPADTGMYDQWTWSLFSPNACSPFKLINGTDANNSLDTDHGRIQIWTSP